MAALAGAERLPHMGKVVPWTASVGADIVDLVVQDEFTHDVIVAADGVWLVFDTT